MRQYNRFYGRKYLVSYDDHNGRNPTMGKIRSRAEKQKKEIRCINNNIVYHSLKEASHELKVSVTSISNVLTGKRNAVKGYKFKFL